MGRGREETDEVVEDVVGLHARGPGVVVADGVEEAVLPDDGEDLQRDEPQVSIEAQEEERRGRERDAPPRA